MKKLPLHNAGFYHLEQGFGEWLDILGYCAQGVYNMPHLLREFLHYLEQHQVNHINALCPLHLQQYHDYLLRRPNQRRGGGLSDKYILMHMQAIDKFLAYLRQLGMHGVPDLGIRLKSPDRRSITVLSQSEIKLLFEASRRPAANNEQQEALQSRDRCMLVIYYSCGLRRNEGVHLSTEDINFDSRILHVRKGKNYKERFVPLSKSTVGILQEYVYDYRPLLLKQVNQSRLFVSVTGAPMTGGTLYSRLKMLQSQTEDATLEQKTIGLHTLRHSIATHLLQAGMSLEHIARFLGHSTMDSTQIYTHLNT